MVQPEQMVQIIVQKFLLPSGWGVAILLYFFPADIIFIVSLYFMKAGASEIYFLNSREHNFPLCLIECCMFFIPFGSYLYKNHT